MSPYLIQKVKQGQIPPAAATAALEAFMPKPAIAPMGKRRSIQIDTRLFEKAGDGNKFFSDMLNRYSVGAAVNPIDSLDLMALLKRHDELDEKAGVGIASFEVAGAPDGHDGKCFWIVRNDGSRIDFSFKHCLEAKPLD